MTWSRRTALLLRADLPGVKPDEIKVEVEDGVLTVSGEHDEKTEKKRSATCVASESAPAR